MKRILILLLLMVALGALAWWLSARDRGTTLSGPLTDFAIADTSSVDRIFIAEKDGHTADLRRQDDGTWTVNGIYRANPVPVRLLLKTFLRVEVRAPVPKSAEANVLRVMGGAAKKVEIYQGGDTPAKIWYVGHATPDHYGTYMVLEKPGEGRSDVPFIMGMSGFSGFLTTRFHAKLDEWRNTDVFAYPDLSTIGVVAVRHVEDPTTSFMVSLGEKGELHLTDEGLRPVAMDTAAVQDFLLQFRSLHFEYIERNLSKAQCDSVRNSPPWHIVTVKEKDGAERRVPFFHKLPYKGQLDMEGDLMTQDVDRMYATVDDTVLVVVQRVLFDRITPPITALVH
ncbi:MAG: hypothetical protein H6594_02315 [Flavobacteriales bacterium]|nr:hypothetical protein [Flavobacteriales bacterium]